MQTNFCGVSWTHAFYLIIVGDNCMDNWQNALQQNWQNALYSYIRLHTNTVFDVQAALKPSLRESTWHVTNKHSYAA